MRFAAISSSARLLPADGGRGRLEGQYGFIDAADERMNWTLHHVPSGEFVGLEFEIGVPPEINRAAPNRPVTGQPVRRTDERVGLCAGCPAPMRAR